MNKIEFTSNPNMNPLNHNLQKPNERRYEDLILKPQFRGRLARFTAPSTWIRIVPAIAGSAYAWMMRLRVIEFRGGRLVHPRTFDRRAACPFDMAYQWMAANHPEALYSKANPSGIRLLARDMTVAWVIIEEAGRPVPKLMVASSYDGGPDGHAGLGHQLWTAAQKYNEDRQLALDAVDAQAGFRLSIEKIRPAGTNRPCYQIELGGTPAPINPLVNAMSEEDQSALVRIEDVIERLPETEQRRCLENALGEKFFSGFLAAQPALA